MKNEEIQVIINDKKEMRKIVGYQKVWGDDADSDYEPVPLLFRGEYITRNKNGEIVILKGKNAQG